jgi:hypothetical protein
VSREYLQRLRVCGVASQSLLVLELPIFKHPSTEVFRYHVMAMRREENASESMIIQRVVGCICKSVSNRLGGLRA